MSTIAVPRGLTFAGVLLVVALITVTTSVPGFPLITQAQAAENGASQQDGMASQNGVALPGNISNSTPDADMWREVRRGMGGHVSISDKNAGTLIQSEGQQFRLVQNGPLSSWGGWLMLAALIAVSLFFALRGRIRVESGSSGQSVERFSVLDRFIHWLTAISFIILALTGLDLVYGRELLLPILGHSVFSTLTQWGKYAHHYVAFAFMLGALMMLIFWIKDNIPTKADLKWFAQGGGMFTKGTHPPAYKFNAGQKVVFWLVILGGFSISVSGICLMFPFVFEPFAPTFAVLNVIGLDLPTTLTPLQETQLALVWHGIVAMLLIALIIAHIYLGTVGMEGAFDAMYSGQVDKNWAKEHHSLWAAEMGGKSGVSGKRGASAAGGD